MERVDCAIVRHHDDGSTTVTAWTVDEGCAEQVASMLGEPHVWQVYDAGRSETLDALAELAVTVER